MRGNDADWRGRPVLVTGSSGFLGRALVRRLLAARATVSLLARPGSAGALAAEIGHRARVLAATLSDRAAVAAAVDAARPETVFHLGAFTDPRRDLSAGPEALEANLTGTAVLAEAALEAGVGAFIAAGTCEEYGLSDVPLDEDAPLRPPSPYSASKAAATLWLQMLHRTHGLPACILRPFLAYGPGQQPPRLVPSAILKALAGEDFPMTEGSQLREFTHADDVVDGFLAAARCPAARGEAINLGSGEEVAVRTMVETIYRLAGGPGRPLLGALPTRVNEMRRFAADTAKAERLLGWRAATPLGEGLARTIAHARRHGPRPLPLDPDAAV